MIRLCSGPLEVVDPTLASALWPLFEETVLSRRLGSEISRGGWHLLEGAEAQRVCVSLEREGGCARIRTRSFETRVALSVSLSAGLRRVQLSTDSGETLTLLRPSPEIWVLNGQEGSGEEELVDLIEQAPELARASAVHFAAISRVLGGSTEGLEPRDARVITAWMCALARIRASREAYAHGQIGQAQQKWEHRIAHSTLRVPSWGFAA